jgi:hypothetical protein
MEDNSLTFKFGAGMGIRMIMNLGLHLDADSYTTTFGKRRTLEEVEIRRRLFWGAFISEKLQSLYLGRPFLIHENDTLVPKVSSASLSNSNHLIEYFRNFSTSMRRARIGDPCPTILQMHH